MTLKNAAIIGAVVVSLLGAYYVLVPIVAKAELARMCAKDGGTLNEARDMCHMGPR